MACERETLEARLRRPDRGENGYREGGEDLTRLDALRRLRELVDAGNIAVDLRSGGVNTHVHTAKSFSFFASPSEAAWLGYVAGLRMLGINDHYTTAGHQEFGEACRILGLLAGFSMEAVAMWEAAEAAGATVNDPSNPGRTYLTAKGVTRAFPDGCGGRKDLDRMNAALFERNREITDRIADLVATRLDRAGSIRFDDVLALTPHDQPTERHVAEAIALWIEREWEDVAARRDVVQRLCDAEVDAATVTDVSALQGFLRGKLIKAGGPAYVDESPEAFIPVERMVSMALDLGAIPTYPVLGNPVTPWEEDLEELFSRLEALGIHAIEVIPDRNTRERLLAIVEAAAERHVPVFNGTEHNTKSALPLVDRFFFEPEFRVHFERGARVLLGHQLSREAGGEGLVRDDGSLAGPDRETLVARLEREGAAIW